MMEKFSFVLHNHPGGIIDSGSMLRQSNVSLNRSRQTAQSITTFRCVHSFFFFYGQPSTFDNDVFHKKLHHFANLSCHNDKNHLVSLST